MVFGFHPSRPRSSGRRIRLRRKLPRQTSPVLLWLRDERNARAALAVAVFVAAAALLAAWSSGLSREFPGLRAEAGRVNRIEYSDVDAAATDQRRAEARRAAARVFAVNADYLGRIQGEIEGLPLLVRGKASLAEVPAATVERHGLDAESFAELQALDQEDELRAWEAWTDRLIGRLATGVPLVSAADFDSYSTATKRLAAVPPRPEIPGDRARSVPLGRDAIEVRTDDTAPLRSRLVAERWYYWAARLAREYAREDDFAKLREALDEDFPQKVLAAVTGDAQKLQPDLEDSAVRAVFEKRRPHSVRTVSYGDGTWLLGAEAAKAGKVEEEQPKDEETQREKEREDLLERIERYQRNQQSQTQGRDEEDGPDPAEFWKTFPLASRSQWIQAYYAEFAKAFELRSVTLMAHADCAGTGFIEVLQIGAGGSRRLLLKDPGCNGVGVRRRISFR